MAPGRRILAEHMTTPVTTGPVPAALHLKLAAQRLHDGAVLACPTEAVFGLSCDPFAGAAVQRLLAIKQRPMHKGLIVVAASEEQLLPLLAPLPAAQRALLSAGWPGPNTWVLPNRGVFPGWITGGKDTVAVRVSAHPVVRALCLAFGGALVSTSANRAGRPPARSAVAVRARLGGLIDGVVPGETGTNRNPTVIRELATGRVLRPS